VCWKGRSMGSMGSGGPGRSLVGRIWEVEESGGGWRKSEWAECGEVICAHLLTWFRVCFGSARLRCA
jgi:hypothetical protein